MTCGTHSTYSRGCRCEACREANRVYWRAWRERRRDYLAAYRHHYWHTYQKPLDSTNPWIDSTGARRRLQALQTMGWTQLEINRRLGQSSYTFPVRGPQIGRSRHQRIAEVYDALCMIPGPSEITRSRAAVKGWAPPLAWDDDTIDDPAAKPNYGLKVPDKGRTIQELLGLGLTPAGIAERLGIKEASVKRYLAPSRSAA